MIAFNRDELFDLIEALDAMIGDRAEGLALAEKYGWTTAAKSEAREIESLRSLKEKCREARGEAPSAKAVPL